MLCCTAPSEHHTGELTHLKPLKRRIASSNIYLFAKRRENSSMLTSSGMISKKKNTLVHDIFVLDSE